MRQHQHRVAVEVPPRPLREDDELPRVAHAGVPLAKGAAVAVRAVGQVSVCVLPVGRLRGLHHLLDLVARRGGDVRGGEGLDDVV